MKTEQFIQRLRPHPPTASSNEATALGLFAEQYPWCGIAHQLFLEAMQQRNDEHFNDYLPKTAIYVVHREQLQLRLYQLKTKQVEKVEETEKVEKVEKVKKTKIAEKVKKEEDDDIIIIEEEPAEEKTAKQKSKAVVIASPSDYFAGEVIEINAESDPIGRFIIERPQIRPIAGLMSGFDLSNQIEQAAPPKKFEDIVSETLAKIYEDQGLVALAQATYEKLSLLEPKKSAYFATRIKNLNVKFKS